MLAPAAPHAPPSRQIPVTIIIRGIVRQRTLRYTDRVAPRFALMSEDRAHRLRMLIDTAAGTPMGNLLRNFWQLGLDRADFGAHSMRRTKATLIYRRTKNLRTVQLLLSHSKLESTVRYLGIEVDDALEISEQTGI